GARARRRCARSWRAGRSSGEATRDCRRKSNSARSTGNGCALSGICVDGVTTRRAVPDREFAARRGHYTTAFGRPNTRLWGEGHHSMHSRSLFVGLVIGGIVAVPYEGRAHMRLGAASERFIPNAAAAPALVLQAPCIANMPHVTGTWTTLPYLAPINPISLTLLHTGQVVIIAGSEDDSFNGIADENSYRVALWNPSDLSADSMDVQNLTYDVFCSGTAALPDGRPLIVGGTASYTFTGDNRASIFDPATGNFVQSQSMADGRWYATALALGDGRIMAFSGLASDGTTNTTVELYDLTNAGNGWSSPIASPFTLPTFPRMSLLPN